MKVLVTGPDGVLGSNLVRKLLQNNYKVQVFVERGKTTPTLEGLDIKFYYGNILNQDDLKAAFENTDYVIHCAAHTSVFPARNKYVNTVNIEGTKNIANACIEFGVKKLIYVGTANSFGFGPSKEELGNESQPYRSLKYGLDYMDSKYHAQLHLLKIIKEKGLNATIVNPTFMIGPFDSKPSSGKMILALYNGKIPGYTKGGKNYIAVKDVVVAIINAIDKGKTGECYILGNENLTYSEAFNKMAEAIGAKAPKRKLTKFMVVTYGSFNSFFAKLFRYSPSVTRELAIISCDKHYYSSEKAQKELDLPQTPIEEAVKESFDWFKNNGYIN